MKWLLAAAALGVIAGGAQAQPLARTQPTTLSDHQLDTVVAGDQGAVGAIFSGADPGTVGPGISGVIYGNTSNPSGNGNGVLPSESPGPWVCTNPSDCAGPTTAGGSMGDFLAPLASGGTAAPVFASGKSPGPDFSGH